VKEQAQAGLEDPRVGTTWVVGDLLCNTLSKLAVEVDQQYHPRSHPTRGGVGLEGVDRISGNAQAMRAAWSSLEAAVETARGCSARALSKLWEIQGNGTQMGAQDKNRVLWETTNKLLKIVVEKSCRMEEWLEALSATSENAVARMARPNHEVPDGVLLWQEIEEGVPLLHQMTSSLEQADWGIAWVTSQWSETDLEGQQTLGKYGEVMSQLRPLLTAGADGLEAGELVRRGFRDAQSRTIPRVGRKEGENPPRNQRTSRETQSGTEQMEEWLRARRKAGREDHPTGPERGTGTNDAECGGVWDLGTPEELQDALEHMEEEEAIMMATDGGLEYRISHKKNRTRKDNSDGSRVGNRDW
jgi:hypothetical protein